MEVFPIVGGEGMAQRLLGKAFKRFAPPASCDAERGCGCERGRSNGRAELVRLKEEERMEGRLKGWRRGEAGTS